jgi:chemotaxis protein CheD
MRLSPENFAVPKSPEEEAGAVYVHPGRLAVTRDGASLVTVVGSGIALCVWDPLRGAGGLAHFLLPEAGGAPPAPRYGDVAMKSLVAEVEKAGATRTSLRARVYGGCAPPIDSPSGHIGDRNVAAALGFLRTHGIPVVERDIGGAGGRKVEFSPKDGTAQVGRIGGAR